jgi:sec-independent protein translocase protein TatC
VWLIGWSAGLRNSPLSFPAEIPQSPGIPVQPEFPDDEAVLSPREKPMGFFDHLEELRWTLIKCVTVYIIIAVVIGIYSREFKDMLTWPLEINRRAFPALDLGLYPQKPFEAMSIGMQITFFGALGVSIPFFLFFLGQFVAPALSRKEMRLLLPVSLAACILFSAGVLFSYFVLTPSAIRMGIELSLYYGFIPKWTPDGYFSAVTWMVLGLGAAFQFPLVVVVLIWLKVLHTSLLRKYRRHAVVIICLIAAVVTPTQDPVTMFLFAAPLYALYEIAILVGRRIEKRRRE